MLLVRGYKRDLDVRGDTVTGIAEEYGRRNTIKPTDTIMQEESRSMTASDRGKRLYETNLGRSHCGLQRRESIVEGAENRDHRLRHTLALAQALAHELRTGLQYLDLACGPHGCRLPTP